MIAGQQNASGNSYVVLQLGSRRFALPAGIVTELAPPVRLHTFPHKSALVAGVIVRRGRIIPIYDVASILLGRSSSVHRFYLIARRAFPDGFEASAIPVSGECELATAELHASGTERPPYIAGTLAIEGDSIDVLNFEALLATDRSRANEPAPVEAQR